MPIATDADVERLRAENPDFDLEFIRHPIAELDRVIIVKRPHPSAWSIYRRQQADVEAREAAENVLFAHCAVFPPKEEISRLVRKYPALPGVVCGEITEMVGVSTKSSHEKV